MSAIRVTSRIQIKGGAMETFQRYVGLLQNVVHREEMGATTIYEYYRPDSQSHTCFVHESYADLESFRKHMADIKTLVDESLTRALIADSRNKAAS